MNTWIWQKAPEAIRIWLALKGWNIARNQGKLQRDNITWTLRAEPTQWSKEERKAIVQAARDMAQDLIVCAEEMEKS